MDTRHNEQPRVLLKVEDAANRLSISRSTMYALIKAGQIATVQIGQLRRVPTTALEEYVQRLSIDQAAA